MWPQKTHICSSPRIPTSQEIIIVPTSWDNEVMWSEEASTVNLEPRSEMLSKGCAKCFYKCYYSAPNGYQMGFDRSQTCSDNLITLISKICCTMEYLLCLFINCFHIFSVFILMLLLYVTVLIPFCLICLRNTIVFPQIYKCLFSLLFRNVLSF